MRLEQNEKLEVQNLIKMLKRAKFDDFQGLEALALARAHEWLQSLLKEPEIVVDVSKPDAPKAIASAEDPFTKTFDVELAKEEPKPKRGRPKKNG